MTAYGTAATSTCWRRCGNRVPDAGEELFRRVAFNIAISNTDDHLRNHAAFWDGRALALTPRIRPLADEPHRVKPQARRLRMARTVSGTVIWRPWWLLRRVRAVTPARPRRRPGCCHGDTTTGTPPPTLYNSRRQSVRCCWVVSSSIRAASGIVVPPLRTLLPVLESGTGSRCNGAGGCASRTPPPRPGRRWRRRGCGVRCRRRRLREPTACPTIRSAGARPSHSQLDGEVGVEDVRSITRRSTGLSSMAATPRASAKSSSSVDTRAHSNPNAARCSMVTGEVGSGCTVARRYGASNGSLDDAETVAAPQLSAA